MEQVAFYFSKSQDDQIEFLYKVLNDYKKKSTEQFEILEKLNKDLNSEAEDFKEKYLKSQNDLEEIFAKIDEYENAMLRIEKIIENSEKDVAALEEYAYEKKHNIFSAMISAIKFPSLMNNRKF